MYPPDADPGAAQDAAIAADPQAAPPQAPERTIDYEGQGKALFDRCIRDAKSHSARLLRDRADIWNLKLDRGGVANHWSIWDPASQRYVERGNDPEKGGLPEYIPRPVTNIFTKTIDGMTAIVDQSEPAQVFAPKTESDEDRAASEVAADAVPVLREECGYDSRGHRHQLNRLASLTNGIAYVLYYDDDPQYGMADLEGFTCKVCVANGVPAGEATFLPADLEQEDGDASCPVCGNTDTESGFELATDEMGMPITTQMPIGKICGEIVPSFEYSLPSSCRRAHTKDAHFVLTHCRMDPADIARMWPAAKDVAKDKASKADGALTRAYADQMRTLASPSAGDSSMGTGGKEFDGPVVYRLHHDPIDDGEFSFPQGFYGVMIAERLIDAGPLPFKDSDGRPFKNILIRSWTDGNYTQFGHPPGDDLAPLQVSYNMVDALVQLIMMHDASPTKYIPESVTLIDQPTGTPGEWIKYRSVDGQKPTSERGQNPPESLFNYLDRIKANFQELSGLNAVLAGSRPEGDPTLGEIQILEERGMASFRAPLDSLIQFEKDLAFMLLDVARQCAWAPRFRRIRGENRQWEIKQFAAADLHGQVDIQVERASAWPKSPLMQQLRVKEAVAMGVLQPAMDPELQGMLLIEMNLSHLKKSLDEDRRQVARELDVWKAATTPDEILAVAPDVTIIELPIHIYLKKQWLKSEEAEEIKFANPPVYQAMVQQVQMLEMAMAQKQMQAAAIAAGPQPAEPAAPGAGGSLEAAVESGAIQPGPAPQAAPQALDGAMAAGVLVPGATPQAPMPPAGPSVDDLLAAKLLTPVMPEAETPGGTPV